ncbi:heparinase II/III domain-containing protein [Pedobacter sp.]
MNSRYIFTFWCLLILINCSASYAQNANRNVLKDFTEAKLKETLLTAEQWKPFPQSPQQWKSKYPEVMLKNIVSIGEEALKKEYPTITATITLDYLRNGNSKARYEKQLFDRREMLWSLCLAESVEGKGRFLDKIIDGIWTISEESFWGSTSILHMQKAGKGLPDVEDPVVDLYVSETASLLAWVDYFNGPALDGVSKLIRQRIRHEVNRRMFNPMLTAKYFYLVKENPNNWAPWIMSNYINAQLLLERDETKRTKAISFAVKLIDKYLNGLGDDGGSDEGPGYWFRGPVCVFDALALLYDASNHKLTAYNHPYLQKIGSYIYRMHLGGENYINIGDAVPARKMDALVIFRYGEATGDQTMMNFGSWNFHKYYDQKDSPFLNDSRNSKSRALYNMAAISACANYAYQPPSVTDNWISDIQIMSSRAENGLIVAAYGGHNGKSHNHNDVGNFLLYLDDEPIIIDLGAGAYTAKTFSDDRYSLWFNTSSYHNLPTINNQGEASGKKYAAKQVEYTKSANSTSIKMDLSGAYPQTAGVQQWLRQLNLDKKKGELTITEDYQINPPVKSITESFMTVCDVDLATPGKIVYATASGKKVLMDYDKNAWEAKKEMMDLNSVESSKFKESWGGKPIWRVLLTNKLNAPKATTTFKFNKM